MFREGERIVLERWPDGGESMKFHLVVRGSLPSNKRGTVDAKQRIRREIHSQLSTLFDTHPTLANLGGSPGRVEAVADDYQRCGFRFVPLVREANSMACSLDIVLLRRDEPHRVMSGSGDLDGRVKTLIDGLRMPQQCSELGGAGPEDDEDPFFVLLEDDRLIYDIRVTSDRLLVPADPGERHRDVVALIRVHVTTIVGPSAFRHCQ